MTEDHGYAGQPARSYHGADLSDAWDAAGGTRAGWLKYVAPILVQAGPGPLYQMTPEFHAWLMGLAKKAV